MANASDAWPQDTAIVSARLAVIEQRLDEILKRLDEMKNLITRLEGDIQPSKDT